MASSIVSSATMSAVNRATPVQSNMVAPFTGLKSSAAFPVTRKPSSDFSSLPSNGGRVQCMKVWPPTGLKKFETLSYLKDLTREELLKQIAYLLRNGWVACVEFELEKGWIYREHHASPGYYDGRYWTMWKLPMYGCTDPAQVLNEVDECAKEYPNCFVRIIGFDNVRQVQCISFIVLKCNDPEVQILVSLCLLTELCLRAGVEKTEDDDQVKSTRSLTSSNVSRIAQEELDPRQKFREIGESLKQVARRKAQSNPPPVDIAACLYEITKSLQWLERKIKNIEQNSKIFYTYSYFWDGALNSTLSAITRKVLCGAFPFPRFLSELRCTSQEYS